MKNAAKSEQFVILHNKTLKIITVSSWDDGVIEEFKLTESNFSHGRCVKENGFYKQDIIISPMVELLYSINSKILETIDSIQAIEDAQTDETQISLISSFRESIQKSLVYGLRKVSKRLYSDCGPLSKHIIRSSIVVPTSNTFNSISE